MNNDNSIIKFSGINYYNEDYQLFSIFSTFFEKKNFKKKVTFADKDNIYLIDNTKHKELFYNGLDYYNFRLSAQNDINCVMAIRYVDFTQAKNILYQPN